MKALKTTFAFLFGLLTLASCGFGYGHDVYNSDDFSLNIGGRMQLIGYGEYVDDPVREDTRVYMFLREARLLFDGQVDGTKYYMQFGYGAENVNGSNNGLTALDFAFDVPIPVMEATWLKVGQFKVPYGRESLTEEGNFQFVDHSIDFLGFDLGRDYGMALHKEQGKLMAVGGIFTGGGRDVPLRYLPENLEIPMLVARVGYNDGLDKDIFTKMSQNDLNPNRLEKAAYVNGMFMKDTGIGHSTVLGVRSSDSNTDVNEMNYMTDPNWNPYLTKETAAGTTSLSYGDYWQVGWDAAARGPLAAGWSWNSEAEANYARYNNGYGRLDLSGARVQGSVIKLPFEIALRWAVLVPDANFTDGGVPITGTMPFYEVTPAITYYIKGHNMKIVADAPFLIGVPVVTEKGVGSYVITEQPDQVTYISAGQGYVRRQDVPEARLMFQVAF